ncbi:MAG TPA: ABC transporter substrate-binding protein [Chloroflexota bacterium]|nr:ABC transporter substrate-binding protein [Chloroflexota bacterium]
MHPEARRASRRDLLRIALGASVMLLVEACGPSPSSGGPAPTAGAPAQVGAGAAPTARPATAAQPTTSAPATAQPTTAPATTTGQARRGGTLRVGLDVDADSLDPRLTKNTSGFRIRELAFNGLVAINPDFTPVPDLAEKWDNPDATTWVFHLRPGVKFHDGTDLTASDVKYTYESVLDPNFNSPTRAFYLTVDKVEATDKNTVSFTLKSPFAPFLSYMDLAIVPQAAAEKSDFGTHPIGTGAFKVDTWTSGDSITLSANEGFYAGRPNLDRVQVKVVPDNSARVVGLESGDLDFVQSPVSPQDVSRVQTAAKLKVDRTPAAGYTYVNLNTADPMLSDKRVRQALSHLVNKQQIIDTIYKGIGKPANGPIVPGMWAYSADVPAYDYNPETAKQLLDAAGWTAGATGTRSKGGQKLSLVVRTHSEDPDRKQLIQVLQSEFQKVGIDATTNTVEFPAFFQDVQDGKFQVGVIGWLNLSDPDRATFRQFTIDGTANYGKYRNDQVDKLLKDARTTLDQSKAKTLYADAVKQIVDDAPYIFVQYQEYIAMYTPKLQGYVINPVANWQSFKTVSLAAS